MSPGSGMGTCPLSVGWGLCLPALDCAAGDESQAAGWGGEELACPCSTEPPNSQNFVPPVFPPVCPSHAAATTSSCDGGHRGTPTHRHQLSWGLPTLGRPQTRRFCGIFSGASEGGMFRAHLQEKRLCWGRAGGGRRKASFISVRKKGNRIRGSGSDCR